MQHQFTVVAIALVLFVGAIGLASRLGSEFLPELDEGTTWVNFSLSSSVSGEEATRTLRMARKAKARSGKDQAAAANRAKFGEGKPAKAAREAEQLRATKALDGNKREQD